MSKPHPLEIQCCHSDDEQGVFSKGHHDFDRFIKAAKEFHGDNLNGWEGKPKHVWWRAVPDPSGDRRCFYHEAAENSRGAFPATVVTEYE